MSRGEASELPKAESPGVGNKAIVLKNCRNVILRDFDIPMRGHFAVLLTAVDNVVINGMTIDTNRDGIDIDCCRNVRVSNVLVNSPWDDAICPKSSFALGYPRSTENVMITNCYVTGMYEYGSLLAGTFKKVTYDQVRKLTERAGFLRLHPGYAPDFMHARNTITECMQDLWLQVTTRLDPRGLKEGDRVGLSFLDRRLTQIGVVQRKGVRSFYLSVHSVDIVGPSLAISSRIIQLRARVMADKAIYSYSLDDGRTFTPLGSPVPLVFSWWKGARPAPFAYNPRTISGGYVDFDWVRYEPLRTEDDEK